MEKASKNLVACMFLLALAGTLTGTVSVAAGAAGIMPQHDHTITAVTGDNSCTGCLNYCAKEYAGAPWYHGWFCRFSCWIGTCCIPPYP